MFFRHTAMSSVLASAEIPVSEYDRLRQAALLIEGGLEGHFPLPGCGSNRGRRVGEAVDTKVGFHILELL